MRRLLLLRLLDALCRLFERLLRLLDVILLQCIRCLLQRLSRLRCALLQLLRFLAQLFRKLRTFFGGHLFDLLRQLLERIFSLFQRWTAALLLPFERLQIAGKLLERCTLRLGFWTQALLQTRFGS